MPRKKSATKLAKEKAEAERLEQLAQNSDKPLPVDIEELKKELREEESEEESEEEEDDYGELLTEDVENGLNEVLKAIKTGDQRLFDADVKFFKDSKPDDENTANSKSSKPLYLKDYHRQTLLGSNEDENDNFTSVDGEKPYAVQQREDKENLVKEIHNALGGDEAEDEDDDDDGFLVKKDKKIEVEDKSLPPISLPDPKEDGEKFLEAFMENHAWLPNKGKEVSMENEDDPEFDEAAEKLENAYNFRYEDPKSVEIISYARSQATMRREKTNSRKRDRLKKQEEKAKEKEQVNEELKKKKQKKVNLVADRIKEIREAVGDEISDEKIMQVFGDSLVNEDFNDEEWDEKMSKIFDDEYYNNDDTTLVKPEWNDNIMEEEAEDDNDEDDDDEEVEAEEESSKEEEETNASTESENKSRKSKKKEEKFNKKQEKNKIKDVAERLVESKTLELLDEVEEELGKDKNKSKYSFKYKEVSPETFGLTYNEIFQADDKDLNDLIGLKKLAPYRPPEKVAKDKRKITKSKNMREWRKRTFGSEAGVSQDVDLDIKIPSIVFDNSSSHKEGPNRKNRKKNHKGRR